jgi:hypothetical protein
MTITIEITDEKAQQLSNMLSGAAESAANLSQFSSAMPFCLSDYGVSTWGLQSCLVELLSLFAGKLPDPQDEDEQEDDDEYDD